MDALVPALVAALVAGVGDRPAWLAALLSARANDATVVAGSALALAAVAAIAVAGGAWIAPSLSPNAGAILLGMALLAAALGAFRPTRPPAGFDRWPAFPAALAGTFVFAVGDGTTFITFALAARSATPALAGAGAFAGTLALVVAAAALGERGWAALPHRALGIAGGTLLAFAGLAALAGGLRLI